MTNFSRLGARKEIGAIRHRLVEAGLSPALRRIIIERHLANLLDTLPNAYRNIITDCHVALNNESNKDMIRCLDRLDTLIPATYGSIPAGTMFQVIDETFIKRKEGVEHNGTISPHFEARIGITIINERSI